MISFSCFFLGERGGGNGQWTLLEERKGAENFRKGFCLRQISPRDWGKLCVTCN